VGTSSSPAPEGRRRAARFPRWQFVRRSRVLAGLEEVLKVLNRGQRLNAWGKVLFFLQAQRRLQGKRPLDLLREHGVKEACLAAEAHIE